MVSNPATSRRGGGRPLWKRIPVACFYLALAVLALWLGMSIPSYFRSVSPLVLEAAAQGTPSLLDQAEDQVQSGRPGLAMRLLNVPGIQLEPARSAAVAAAAEALMTSQPVYRWSGGPAPFYEQFLRQATFLRQDEAAVIPTLLPGEHREKLLGFLQQSLNRNVHDLLATRTLGGWQRFYPVYSNSGQPLDATILTVALLEQSSALPDGLRQPLLEAARQAVKGDKAAMVQLESVYIGILTLGRHMDWLSMQTVVQRLDSTQQLLFTAQAIQEDPARANLLLAAYLNIDSVEDLTGYLQLHGEAGWATLVTALGMGKGAAEAVLTFEKPVYQPPAFWNALPTFVRQSQQYFKGFAESQPSAALLGRLLAFGMCGFFLVSILRVIILWRRPAQSHERRVLVNLDSLIGAVLVTLLVWVMIEPGLLDFRPNEQGTLEIKLAQIVPEDTLSTTQTAATTMIDQVTILVLLLFFIIQMLVFVMCLLKIAEIRRQELTAELKLRLLDNEENLFDLGLYVGLGGTVSSLILVVLNIVDASLMAAYASTLFGIIFVATLKIGYLRPFRRRLILQKS